MPPFVLFLGAVRDVVLDLLVDFFVRPGSDAPWGFVYLEVEGALAAELAVAPLFSLG